MGHLTDDMTRLRDEIVGLHEARKAFLDGLTCAVKDMMRDFRSAFRKACATAAEDRSKFTANLREAVSQMLSGFHADMAGARSAWCGGATTAPVRSEKRAAAKPRRMR